MLLLSGKTYAQTESLVEGIPLNQAHLSQDNQMSYLAAAFAEYVLPCSTIESIVTPLSGKHGFHPRGN